MENEKENIVPNDHRAITIHKSLRGRATDKQFLINDIKISIYYLPKNSYKLIYDTGISIKEGGYIIEAQAKILVRSKIKLITKKDFNKIYKEFENINLKALEKERYEGRDGSRLEVKMGMLEYNNDGLLHIPLRYTKETMNISLRSPYEDKKRPEMSKLFKLIKNIKAKVEFDKWHKCNYEEWEKCYNTISHLENIFRVGIKNDLDRDW